MGARRDSGFTLIELMVVVAIIAVVAAAVAPSFSMTLQRNRQYEAGNLIVEAVLAARSRAARTGRCHRVSITMSAPGLGGGNGGVVTVDEFQQATACSLASANAANWRQLSQKTVGGPGGGLIGEDIAIRNEIAAANCQPTGASPLRLFFEPTGGMFVNNAQLRFISVEAYTNDGLVTGVTQHVRISPGGAVKYTLCGT